MKKITLPKAGGTAVIDVLGEADIFDVINLHETTRAALQDENKRFILQQPTSYFKNLLAGATGRMLGVRAGRKLVAQLALVGPMSLREAIRERVITYNNIPFHHAALNDSVMVIKSMSSLPEWRGNDLAKQLSLYAETHPFTRVADHLFTQISVANCCSWKGFVKNDFGLIGAAYDPKDGKPRFVFQKSAFGFDLEPQAIADEACPTADFDAIVSLTQREGLIGTFEGGQTNTLSFMRNREEISLMPVLARVSGRH